MLWEMEKVMANGKSKKKKLFGGLFLMHMYFSKLRITFLFRERKQLFDIYALQSYILATPFRAEGGAYDNVCSFHFNSLA